MAAHKRTEAGARTGNSHKEMKTKGGTEVEGKPAPTHRPSERWGGTTGRREAGSDSQAIREVGVMGVPVYYSHGTAPSQLLRCMCPTRTIHIHSRRPFSHFPPGFRYRWQIVPTTALPGGVQASDLTCISRRRTI